jgi:competence transcription factor ComK
VRNENKEVNEMKINYKKTAKAVYNILQKGIRQSCKWYQNTLPRKSNGLKWYHFLKKRNRIVSGISHISNILVSYRNALGAEEK